MASNINPSLTPVNSLTNFKFWCQKVLPLVYDDSLSYYEVLGKMVVQLNDVIDNVNADTENVLTLKDAFLELQTYVNNFFDDIDQLASYAERAEAAQTAANTSAVNAATSASNASASSLAAMDARDTAVTAKQAAETSANTASTAAANANTKANEAAQSAITAQTAQASASQSATLAATDRSAAQTAANTATTKANEASTSASNAETSATNAADSATEAVAAVGTVVNGLGNITKTIENAPIATTEDALPSLAKKLVVDIEPVQSGSGDPSPDNVRPITGWTKAKISKTGKNICNGIGYNGFISANILSIVNSAPVTSPHSTTIGYGGVCFSASVKKGQRYVLSSDVTGDTTPFYWAIYPSLEAATERANALQHGTTQNTLTAEYDGILIFMRVNSAVGTSVTWSYAQVELGSIATDYEPYSGETYDITFPSEAGTVYGGTLTNLEADEWKLEVETVFIELDGTETGWTKYGTETILNAALLENTKDITAIRGYCSHVGQISGQPQLINSAILSHSNAYKGLEFKQVQSNFGIADNEVSTWTSYLAAQKANNTPIQIVAYLETPLEYTITATEIVELLAGYNNVWADTGNINTLEYFTNAENYVTSQVDLAKALIAPILKNMIADTALVANDFRIVGNTLYRITGNVASGGRLTPNTNCVATTVGAILKSLLSV